MAVATDQFITPARIQASALGRAGFEAVFVPHPIQDQTPEQIAARADVVTEEIVRRLTSQ